MKESPHPLIPADARVKKTAEGMRRLNPLVPADAGIQALPH